MVSINRHASERTSMLNRYNSTQTMSSSPCHFIKLWLLSLLVVAVGVYGWIYSPRDAMQNSIRVDRSPNQSQTESLSATKDASTLNNNQTPAFSLLVDLHFQSDTNKQQFFKDIAPVAKYVQEQEPTTLSYQVLQSDQDPLRVLVLERYQDKDEAYLQIHKSSQPFKDFRTKLQKMTQKKQVTIGGHSYLDHLQVGFSHRPTNNDAPALTTKSSTKQSLKKKKSPSSNIFTLLVTLDFLDEPSIAKFLKSYQTMVAYVRQHEPTTYTYDVLRSDQNPYQLLLLDRYADKEEAYLKTHKSSSAFLAFRPQLKDMVENVKTVQLSGQSYVEATTDGLGFFTREGA